MSNDGDDYEDDYDEEDEGDDPDDDFVDVAERESEDDEAPDLEKDWQALGRPSPFQRKVNEVKRELPGMLERVGHGLAWVWKTFWAEAFNIGILVAVVCVLVIGYQALSSDGRIDYCFIEVRDLSGVPGVSVVYGLKAHRKWRPDNREIGTFLSLDEAIEGAKKLGCPFK